MERRLAASTSSPLFRARAVSALLLAGVLTVVMGPGAAASRAPSQSQTPLTAAAVQSDPIGDLASNLEYDAEKIFRFVADEVRYEPYPGILRGAKGTLEARAGNSVDKSLLLAALLDDSQIQYRFARGSLDQATTATIVDSMATDIAGARNAAEDPLKRGLDEITASTTKPAAGPLAALYEQQASSVVADSKKRLDLAKSRLGDTVTMLEGALDGAGIRLPAGAVSLPPDEVAGHTWVQMAYGTTWVDLDPTLPASQPGTVLTPASETLGQLPDDLRYQVEFDVLVERASGGQLATRDVLTYTGFADQLAGSPVTFGHVTPSGMQSLGLTLSNLLGKGWLDYRPTLEVGTHSLVADESVAFPTGGTDLFGSQASPGASPLDGEATAEWLEVRVTPPGSEPEVARRTIFDRLPPDLRAAGELTPGAVEPIELVDFHGTGSNDYLPMLGIRKFAIATGPTSAAPVAVSSGDPLAGFALAYHNVRDAMDAEMALDAGARTFVDGPNIVSLSIDARGDAQGTDVSVGLDIWHRSHGTLPLTGSSLSGSASQLVAGVTDHVAERFAVEGLAGAPRVPHTTIGVSDVFEAAATEGIPTLVVQGTVPDSLPYGAKVTGLLRDAVASGDVVIVPDRSVMIGGSERVGWWRIDPRTGATTDVMDSGSGAEMAEYTVIVDSEVGQLICIGSMALEVAGLIVASATMLGSYLASSLYRVYLGGVGGTSCV